MDSVLAYGHRGWPMAIAQPAGYGLYGMGQT